MWPPSRDRRGRHAGHLNNECHDCFRVRRYHPFTDNLSLLVDDANSCQLQGYIQSDIVLHCGPPSLQGPMRWASLSSWRADSQYLDVAHSRNYPMCENAHNQDPQPTSRSLTLCHAAIALALASAT